MKKRLSFVLIFVSFIVLFGLSPVSAKEIDNNNSSYLDQRGLQALEDAENVKDVKIETYNSNYNGLIQPFSTNGMRVKAKRGSFLAWVEGIVDWTYSGSRIHSSTGDQDSGYVFPNLVTEKGIKKLSTSNSFTHLYRSKSSIAAGTPTPWGDVKVFEQGYTDHIYVYGDGDYAIDWD